MLESLVNRPLLPENLPSAARKPASPEAPKPLKMMAAKGALPIPPDALIYVWYQLSFDEDAEVQAAVSQTLATFDTPILVDLAQKDLPECLLDWMAKTCPNPAVIEKIILNAKTHDATLMDLATVSDKDMIELIAMNHVRLLRAPEIIEKIYLNPKSRMATVDKVMALAREHGIVLTSLKDVQEALNELPHDDEPGLSDEEFSQVLAESAQMASNEKSEGLPDLRTTPQEDEEKSASYPHPTSEQETLVDKNGKKLTHAQLVERMNAPQRIKLAVTGSREDRTILLRDSRRIVYMSVIKSPKMSIGEVGMLASSRTAPDEMIAYIASRRDWIRYYPIVVSLVNNPKCPLADAVTFMKQLRTNDLKLLQKSKNISAQLQRQAQMLFRQKDQKK